MRVLVVINKSNPKTADASLLLSGYLASQDIDYVLLDGAELADPMHIDESVSSMLDLSEGFDLAIVLGGDGTILHTACLVTKAQIPILGINFGHLGFLANSSEPGVVAVVAAALAGDVIEEQRANLQIDVMCEDDASADAEPAGVERAESETVEQTVGEPTQSFFALNELTISRGASGRMVDFSLEVSGDYVATMRGDDLVISTATGSTAYALSAGGPLVAPGYRGLVVVPLVPHTLQSRAIVTDQNDIVEVALTSETSRTETMLFVDGEALSFDRPISSIVVRRGAYPTTLLRYKPESFYRKISNVFF